MKIAVIGANSYIARNLICFIRKHENDVSFRLYDIQEDHLDALPDYERVNTLDKEDVRKIDFDVDLLYVFTGKTGTYKGFDEYDSYLQINEMSLLNILDVYREAFSKAKIIFPSTRLVYKGRSGRLKEDDEKEFKTIYAINKYACEQYLKMYHNCFDIPYLIFRICVPYGSLIPGVSSYGTAEFMIRNACAGKDITLYGGGIVRRTLIHIEDLCNALFSGAECESCVNDVFNIGGEDYSLKEMALLISDKYGNQVTDIEWPEQQLKIESGDTVFDSDKFDHLTGFVYRHNFKQWLNEETI